MASTQTQAVWDKYWVLDWLQWEQIDAYKHCGLVTHRGYLQWGCVTVHIYIILCVGICTAAVGGCTGGEPGFHLVRVDCTVGSEGLGINIIMLAASLSHQGHPASSVLGSAEHIRNTPHMFVICKLGLTHRNQTIKSPETTFTHTHWSSTVGENVPASADVTSTLPTYVQRASTGMNKLYNSYVEAAA